MRASSDGRSLAASPARVRRVRLMGAPLAAVKEEDVVHAVVMQRANWVITANLDHVRRYTREAAARDLIDAADLVVADGTPLVWLSRIVGAHLPERVAGSNLIWSICEAASACRRSVFLIGGNPGTAVRAAEILTTRYDDLKIVGTSCPPLGFERDAGALRDLEEEVTASSPDVVLVALGFPKQDVLIRRLRVVLPCASFMGVGISLSFVAGDVARAPRWTHAIGLEWVHRLLQEPRRLGRRYLVDGLPFAARALCLAVGHRLVGNRPTIRWGWDASESVMHGEPHSDSGERHHDTARPGAPS
jgi:N-acetylglucosaminyldiphosphoundecaprenol N-acetyl-beta-D-mannosaminyltransferase